MACGSQHGLRIRLRAIAVLAFAVESGPAKITKIAAHQAGLRHQPAGIKRRPALTLEHTLQLATESP
jgi:hypothetical protein